MSFDLNDFVTRAVYYAEAESLSLHTLSKKLFSTARTLPGMVGGNVSPRLKTLQTADERLKKLEAKSLKKEAA